MFVYYVMCTFKTKYINTFKATSTKRLQQFYFMPFCKSKFDSLGGLFWKVSLVSFTRQLLHIGQCLWLSSLGSFFWIVHICGQLHWAGSPASFFVQLFAQLHYLLFQPPFFSWHLRQIHSVYCELSYLDFAYTYIHTYVTCVLGQTTSSTTWFLNKSFSIFSGYLLFGDQFSFARYPLPSQLLQRADSLPSQPLQLADS